jgi:hypothetical protein
MVGTQMKWVRLLASFGWTGFSLGAVEFSASHSASS